MNRKFLIGIPLLAGFLFVFSAGVSAQTDEAREVVSSGVGYIMAGDVAHARDDAIDDALRKGIEQVLGTMVESETLVENFQLIEDNIMTKTRGYVQKYDIVKEGKRDAQMYEVTVRAILKVSNIQDDLEGISTLMRRKNTPRVMVMIDEKNVGETPGFHYFEAEMNTAETTLMNYFMAKGFRFIDRATVQRYMDQQKASAILQGDTGLAAALGKQVGAEVVLTGKAMAKATVVEAYGAKIRSQQATVQIKAIRTDTGDIIATTGGQGKHSHIDDMQGGVIAIQEACNKLAEPLMSQILNQWQTDVSSGATIVLNVEGVNDYTELSNFKNSLKYYVRGMQSANQRSYSGGLAVLEVVMKGSADDLAQRLTGKDFNGKQARVTGMTQNSVTVRLVGSQTQ